jgi:hypothetical protein
MRAAKKPTGQPKRSVQKKVNWKALEMVHPEAAGIDVGGSEHWVAINPERDPERSALRVPSGGREARCWPRRPAPCNACRKS